MIDYSKFSDCIESTFEREIFVIDTEEGISKMVDCEPWDVKILNQDKKQLHFIKIDQCIFSEMDGKRADFGISSDDKIFFIEIKTFERKATKGAKRKDSKIKLASTINYFKDYGLSKMSNTFAVITIVPKIFEKRKQFIIQANQAIENEKFRQLCGCPNLFEGNFIEF